MAHRSTAPPAPGEAGLKSPLKAVVAGTHAPRRHGIPVPGDAVYGRLARAYPPRRWHVRLPVYAPSQSESWRRSPCADPPTASCHYRMLDPSRSSARRSLPAVAAQTTPVAPLHGGPSWRADSSPLGIQLGSQLCGHCSQWENRRTASSGRVSLETTTVCLRQARLASRQTSILPKDHSRIIALRVTTVIHVWRSAQEAVGS
jgi:hypothetical protein